MIDIKAGVTYEAKMTVTPKRVGQSIFGSPIVIDDEHRSWPVDLFDSFEEVPDLATKRRRAAIQLLADLARDAVRWEVDAAWEQLFVDEASTEDKDAVLRIAREATATLLAEEGVIVDGDDD